MTVHEIVATYGGKPVTWRKWLRRMCPHAKIGPVYNPTPAQVDATRRAMAEACQGWPKGKPRGHC